jgi:predicted nuclease with TOPRIM domain
MRESLELRLKELRQEFESGERRLSEVAAEHARLKETLLRIAGAIQVLEEELDKAAEPVSAPDGAGGGSG